MMRFSKKLVLSAACLLMAVSALAQDNTAPTVEFKLGKPKAVAGDQIKGTVTLTFAPGLHGYQNPPSEDYMIPVVVKVDGKEFKLVKAIYPAGRDELMGGAQKPVKAYSGAIVIPIVLLAPVKAGNRALKIVVSYQQCNDTSCFQPGDVSATAKILILPKPAKKGKG